jgi:hypothetical protein
MSQKFLTPINLALNELQNGVIANLAAAPSGVAGQVYFDTVLHEFGYHNGTTWVYPASGASGITAVSVASANGFGGSSSGGTTPALTLTTSISGLLMGSASAIVAASAGTDYLAPAGNGSALTGLTQSQISGLAAALALLAPVAAPTFTGAAAFSGTVTVPTPTVSGQAAPKSYVDGVAQGLPNKYSAVAATLGTETYTISAGSVTVISGTTLDGQSPSVNDYVLVKDAPAASGTGSAASTQPGNGLYLVTNATTNLTVSRAADMSGSNGPAGSYVFIEGGTQASSGWAVSTPSTSAAFTYGTNNIKFTQFSGAGEIIAGSGLAKAGNTLSISAPVSVANGGTNATSVAAAKTSLGFGSIYNSGAIGGSTTLTVTHSLGNAIPLVQVWDISGANPVVAVCDVASTSANVITLGFTSAPASSSIKCVVMG